MWHEMQPVGTVPREDPLCGGDGCGSGSGGRPHPVELEGPDPGVDGIDDVDANAVQRDVAHRITQAGPDQPVGRGLATWADELLRPKVDWRRLLRSAYRGAGRPSEHTEPTWRRPSRRPAGPGMLLPGTQRRPAPRIAVVIDTSGSMNHDMLKAALAELNALIHHGGSRRTAVIACDERAEPPQIVRRIPDLEFGGGGYTDMRAGIRAAAEVRPSPHVIVVLTDGYTRWPDCAPPATSMIVVVIDEDIRLPRGRGIRAVRVVADR